MTRVRAATDESVNYGNKIALFIDVDNTTATAANVLEIISYFSHYGKVVFTKLYGYNDDKFADFGKFVIENQFETAPKMQYNDGKSVVDTRLVMDIMKLTGANNFDTVFIWAGNGDVAPLFSHLKEIGVTTATIETENIHLYNRFVDSKLRLYSAQSDDVGVEAKMDYRNSQSITPISSSQHVTIDVHEEAKSVATKSPTAMPDILKDYTPPSLPRRKGAPEFGETEASLPTFLSDKESGENEPEMSDQDFVTMALNMQKRYEEEMKEEGGAYEMDDAELGINSTSISSTDTFTYEQDFAMDATVSWMDEPALPSPPVPTPLPIVEELEPRSPSLPPAPLVPEPPSLHEPLVKEFVPPPPMPIPSTPVQKPEPVFIQIEPTPKPFVPSTINSVQAQSTEVSAPLAKLGTKRAQVVPQKSKYSFGKSKLKPEPVAQYSPPPQPEPVPQPIHGLQPNSSPDSYDDGNSYKYRVDEVEAPKPVDIYDDFDAALSDFTV